jgi:hypothetical protein
MLRGLGTIRHTGRRIPLHAADVWLHRNRPGERDQLLDVPPFRLELPRGIAVSASEGRFPRLPLLGLRALLGNQLHLTVSGERDAAWLRTPHWFLRVLQALRLPPY